MQKPLPPFSKVAKLGLATFAYVLKRMQKQFSDFIKLIIDKPLRSTYERTYNIHTYINLIIIVFIPT